MLTNRKIIRLSDADECRKVLKSPHVSVLNMSEILTEISLVTGKNYPWLHAYACKSPFNLNGEEHKEIRRILASYFSSKRINSWAAAFRGIAEKIVLANRGKEQIDLQIDWVMPITAECTYHALGLKKEVGAVIEPYIENLLLLTSFERQLKVKDISALDFSSQQAADTIRSYRIIQQDYDNTNAESNLDFAVNDMYNYLACNFNLPTSLIYAYMAVTLVAGASTKHTLANVLLVLLRLETSSRASLLSSLGTSELLERALYVGGGVETIYRMMQGEDLYCLDIAKANKQISACPFSQDQIPTSKHLAFGYGSHKCIGEMLSRSIMEIALEVICKHYPNAKIIGPEQQVFINTPFKPITVDL